MGKGVKGAFFRNYPPKFNLKMMIKMGRNSRR